MTKKLPLVLLFLTLLPPLVSWGQDQPPTGLLANADAGPVTLTWKDMSSDETGFRVERKTGDGPWVQIATVAIDVQTFTDSVYDGNIYCYRVFAFNSWMSPFSNEACITRPSMNTVPSAPANVKLNSVMFLTWNDVKGEDGYHIECNQLATPYRQVADVAPNQIVYHHHGSDKSLNPCCQVRAWNKLGDGPYSAVACVTP